MIRRITAPERIRTVDPVLTWRVTLNEPPSCAWRHRFLDLAYAPGLFFDSGIRIDDATMIFEREPAGLLAGLERIDAWIGQANAACGDPAEEAARRSSTDTASPTSGRSRAQTGLGPMRREEMDINSMENTRHRVVALIDEAGMLLDLIPKLLDDNGSLRASVEAAAKESEALRGEIGTLRAEIQQLRTEREETTEILSRVANDLSLLGEIATKRRAPDRRRGSASPGSPPAPAAP